MIDHYGHTWLPDCQSWLYSHNNKWGIFNVTIIFMKDRNLLSYALTTTTAFLSTQVKYSLGVIVTG